MPKEFTLPLAGELKGLRVSGTDIAHRRHTVLSNALHIGVAKLWFVALLAPVLGAEAAARVDLRIRAKLIKALSTE